MQEAAQAPDHTHTRPHLRRQLGERGIALLEQRIDLAVLGEQAVDDLAELRLLLPQAGEQRGVLHHVVAVQRLAVALPFFAQRLDGRRVAGEDPPQRAREQPDVAPEPVV